MAKKEGQLVTRELMHEYAMKLKNWGKWGPEDEVGALNYITPEAIVEAVKLVKKGKVFALGIPFGPEGPQSGWKGRTNPQRLMIASGTDFVARDEEEVEVAYSDDYVCMPTQCATHWDALGHVFYRYKENGKWKTVMWNGYNANRVTSKGLEKGGIHNMKKKMVGRGVLLDIARYKGIDPLPDSFGISSEDLDGCAAAEKVKIKSGDFLLIRTGQLGQRLRDGWGEYAAGPAPGLEFETLKWIHDKEIAAVCSDTWGIEVRPNRTNGDIFQPWHQITIPILGVTHGEMFWSDELAADCAADGQWAFLLVAPVIPFTNGAGSPVNPIALK